MGRPTSGAAKAQQNIVLIDESTDAALGTPEVGDPYTLYNAPNATFPGLYYFDPVTQEFHLLSNAIKAVGQGFGGLSYDGVAVPLTIGTTPVKLTGFDTVEPATGPIEIGVDLGNSEIDITTVGVFQFYAQVTSIITSSRSYVIEVFKNGVKTNIEAGLDASNQTDGVFLSLSAMRSITVSDLPAVIDLRVVSSAAGSQFDILNAEFGVYRISSLEQGLV